MPRNRKRALPPRAKRMDRSARLQSARTWLKTYSGKNIAAGYRRHFAVDWVCAFRELEMLGVKTDSAYKDQILKSVEGQNVLRADWGAERGDLHNTAFGAGDLFDLGARFEASEMGED